MRITVFLVAVLLSLNGMAQRVPDSLQYEWVHLDPEKDGVFGVGTNRAYEFLKGKKPTPIIVAVIDSGLDYDHEDLSTKVWKNTEEIEANGKDDDKNGYIDDIRGWNFIGGEKGNVHQDTHVLTREYVRLKKMYEGKSVDSVPSSQKEEFAYWQEISDTYLRWSSKSEEEYRFYASLNEGVVFFDSLFRMKYQKEEITYDDLIDQPEDDSLTMMGKGLLNFVLTATEGRLTVPEIIKDLNEATIHYREVMEYSYNTEFDPRNLVGDNYEDLWERYYGNADVEGPYANHGTAVSGVIAANRENEQGIRGVSDAAIIMPIRAVPAGDERDKDIANAILYAVDNGAKIINMSFGKGWSPGKVAVDSAVRYAEEKGVILVHASGNESENRDKKDRYPTARFQKRSYTAGNFIEVGANAWNGSEQLIGSFSNYGKETVDFFAPGVSVMSTAPGNDYDPADGTSLAAPIVSGVAALVWSYYPQLSYKEVMEVLRKSVVVSDVQVNVPGEEGTLDSFSNLSIYGGVVNAYNAVVLAEKLQQSKLTIEKK